MEEENKENKKKNGAARFLVDGAKGVTLGISAAVPGLSAGTIAVAESCYDTLIDAIASLRKEFGKSFLTLLPYIVGLIVGAMAALIGIAKGYEAAPFSLTGFFAGFVFGSLPVTFKELKRGNSHKEKTTHVLSFVLCLLLAGGIGVLTALTRVDLASYLQQRVWWIYLLAVVSGLVASFACIVPGISGSMSLMVIGMYYPILHTFFSRSDGLSIWGNPDGGYVGTGIVLLLLLALGAVIGVVLASKIMKVLLSKHRVSTFYGILGLILGSLVSMFVNSDIYPKYQAGIATWDYILGAVLFAVSSCAVILLLRYADKKKAQKDSLKAE